MGNVASKPLPGSSLAVPQPVEEAFEYSQKSFSALSQYSDSGNSSGKSQHETFGQQDKVATATTTIAGPSSQGPSAPASVPASASIPSTATVHTHHSPYSSSSSGARNKPLPASPVSHSPGSRAPPSLSSLSPGNKDKDQDTKSNVVKVVQTKTDLSQEYHPSSTKTRLDTLSQSQSSLSDRASNHSNNSNSSNSTSSLHSSRTITSKGSHAYSPTLLTLQRFPTGENENNVSQRPSTVSRPHQITPTTLPLASTASLQERSLFQIPTHDDPPSVSSRSTSMVSTSSARSSSGSTGFKFSKPNLSFKPLYSHGNNSKNHHPPPVSSPNGHSVRIGARPASPGGVGGTGAHPLSSSPFPPILLSIQLPQSLLSKYVIDLESFRHGKGIWGVGQYSWTITVLSRTNGKKYVIKRVSKALLPPSSYYHYPKTAHQLCTCPACKSSREQLLLSGQLDPNDLDHLKEVLITQSKGRKKELPQIPSSPSSQQKQSQRSISPPLTMTPVKEKRQSTNLYHCNNVSQPNQGRFFGFSSTSTPQDTPVNSRPATPSQSPHGRSTTPLFNPPSASSSSVNTSPPGKTHNRSLSHCHSSHSPSTLAGSSGPSASPAAQSSQLPLFPKIAQERSRTAPFETMMSTPSSPGLRILQSPTSPRSLKKKPGLQRHASTPNLSHQITGLDVLEEDPSRSDQLKQLSRLNVNDWQPQDGGRHPLDSPLSLTMTMPSFAKSSVELAARSDTESRARSQQLTLEPLALERKVDPFDTNRGEFKRMDPESPQSPSRAARSAAMTFVPPPHALPMELVLLQTYNDSDHLPEHHEWTQDHDYWYYVTKAHGVRRRKLKKVSSWWLDVGSLSGALLSGSSSPSEPIATGPIYNMGRASPIPSSPLSSQVSLGRHMPKDSISSLTSQESGGTMTPTMTSSTQIKRQSSPRSSSHMGKYFHVDWEEYISL